MNTIRINSFVTERAVDFITILEDKKKKKKKSFMIGVNVWWVHLAPQNIPRAVSVLTLGNKVVL